MQCFALPKSIVDQLGKLHKNFKPNTEQGLPLIAWDKLCGPKTKGGLGLCKIEAVSQAFQCKLASKFLPMNLVYGSNLSEKSTSISLITGWVITIWLNY